ncbi:Ig-like domain-containing protein [Pseudonocardia eucalypti]|uniref:Ig-like domain-containing protein n=1 Tax=Pseudonocardia eucalypti TaxID=648755 RepID=A0ABP9PJT6_9PSEU
MGSASGFAVAPAPRRWASGALGIASVLIGVAALVTATRGPGAIEQALPESAPPAPVARVAIASAATLPAITPAPATPGSPTDAGAINGANPATPISVAVADGTVQTVKVTDPRGASVPGEAVKGGWHTTVGLAYGTAYRVDVAAVGADGQPVHQTRTVNTVKPALLAYPSFIPAPGQQSVGVGQPLVVKFDHPVTDRAAAERALKVTTSPEQPGSWYWISPSEAHYRGKEYWQPNTTISLHAGMFGVDLGKGTFGELNRDLTVHVHDSWVAKADGKVEQMQIFHNGALVNTMPISLGSPGHPSHLGPHVVSDKMPTMTMDSCTYGVCEGDPGYYKEKVDLDLRISNDGEFVHSAPWSTGQQGDSNVSHGCVNLSPANAKWFFDHFNVGDVVEITNSGGPALPVYDTYGDWELDWPHWQSGSALR